MNWTNVFLNNYFAQENRLTYNFLCVIELMDALRGDFLRFLVRRTKFRLAPEPLSRLDPVFAFAQGSNPDGCLRLLQVDGSELSVFLEVKTFRRLLDPTQLLAHLKYHVQQQPQALLLVLTPRPCDSRIVESLNDERLVFLSWQEVADYLDHASRSSAPGSLIVKQFLKYAKEVKEFMPSELEKKDIDLFIEYVARRPDEKIRNAFELLASNFSFGSFLQLRKPAYWNDAWGRKGIDIQLSGEKDFKWMTFGIYYDTEDHGIPFLAGCPELALFIDIDPKKRSEMKKNSRFVQALTNLEKLGWEENLSKERTDNEWRLLWWRKPLTEFGELTVNILAEILETRFNELKSEPEFSKGYFAQQTFGADLA